MNYALILVDIQNDFMPGGNLAVPDGDEIVDVVNTLSRYSIHAGSIVVATQDWHPAGHGSFASAHGAEVMSMGELDGLDQVMWPDHCVQGTEGAEFHTDLDMSYVDKVFQKGTNPLVDSYSGFFDNARRGDTGLHEYLQGKGVTDVTVCGLARDYCVAFTALDAVSLGYKTTLVFDACRAVDFPENNDAAMCHRMLLEGINIITANEFTGE